MTKRVGTRPASSAWAPGQRQSGEVASPVGNVQMAWIWSGKITMALTCSPWFAPGEKREPPPRRGGSMWKSRCTEEPIIAVLKAAENGQKVTDLCRKHGISEHTFYPWRAKYGGWT
jgi:putative transposase